MAHLWLGHVYRAQGENAKAILSYEKAELPEAYDNLGLLYLEQGDLEKAYANLRKAADAWPNFAPVELHLGNYYVMAKDYSKAKASYETALKIDPKLFGAKLNMGLLALADQQYESARAFLESFLEEGNPDAALKSRVEGYLKLVNQKIQLEKQRHENNT
jgi:tetratricopeptide (TPR) repeat protein